MQRATAFDSLSLGCSYSTRRLRAAVHVLRSSRVNAGVMSSMEKRTSSCASWDLHGMFRGLDIRQKKR
jgi:hypothetical protein